MIPCSSISLYEGKGVRNLPVRISHDWGIGIEELIEFEFMHEFVGFCSVSGEDGGLLAFHVRLKLAFRMTCAVRVLVLAQGPSF